MPPLARVAALIAMTGHESALGDTDISDQSGRAIEARQRQAVISVQTYMDNFRHTKHLSKAELLSEAIGLCSSVSTLAVGNQA